VGIDAKSQFILGTQRKEIIIKEAYHENTNSATGLSRSGVIF
jgi:hypothetical protein